MPGFNIEISVFPEIREVQNSNFFQGSISRDPLDEARAFGARSANKLSLENHKLESSAYVRLLFVSFLCV